MTADIIPIRGTRHVSLRRALDDWQQASEKWIDATINLAAELAAARSECGGDNHAFNVWLAEHDCADLGRDARAALINLGRHLDITREQLQITKRRSVELIWSEEVKPLVDIKPPASERSEDDAPSPSPPEPPPPAPPEPEKPQIATCNETESVVEVTRPSVNSVTLPRTVHHGGGRKWVLDEKKNADLVHAHITGKEPRTMLPNLLRPRGAAGLWDLLVHSILKGYYGPPAHGTKSPGLHLVLPWLAGDTFARSFDLRQSHDRKEVMEIVFPLLDRQPELREHPDQLAVAVRDERRRIADERHQAAKLARHQGVVKSHDFAVGEQEVIAFGEPLWPQDSPRYSYHDLCHACWYVNFWLGLAAAAKWSPTATGMQGRHLVKYLEPVSPGAVLAIYDVLNAYQQNPEGEKKFPTVPVNFGHDG